MVDPNAIHELVSCVVYNKGYDGLDGLNPLRHLLWKDADGTVAAYLEQEMRHAPDKVRGGIAFLLGSRYLEIGCLDAIRAIYRNGDPEVTASVLGSLTGEPTAHPEMGSGIVALAVEGASHLAYHVRASACSVLMNQCAWGVDVSSALTPLLALLEDTEAEVRQSAAYAIGNFARVKRYDLTPHMAILVRLLHDENVPVGTAPGGRSGSSLEVVISLPPSLPSSELWRRLMSTLGRARTLQEPCSASRGNPLRSALK